MDVLRCGDGVDVRIRIAAVDRIVRESYAKLGANEIQLFV